MQTLATIYLLSLAGLFAMWGASTWAVDDETHP